VSAEPFMYSDSATFKKKAVGNYTVNGVAAGTFKPEGDLSWLSFFGAVVLATRYVQSENGFLVSRAGYPCEIFS
jgi:hypothetical protein